MVYFPMCPHFVFLGLKITRTVVVPIDTEFTQVHQDGRESVRFRLDLGIGYFIHCVSENLSVI